MIPDRILLSTFSFQNILSVGIPSSLEGPVKSIAYSKIGKVIYPTLILMQTRLTGRVIAEVIAGVSIRVLPFTSRLDVVFNPSSLFCPPRLIYAIFSSFGLLFLEHVAEKSGNRPLSKMIHLLFNLNLGAINVINLIACLILIGTAFTNPALIPWAILNIACLGAIWIPYFFSYGVDPKNAEEQARKLMSNA